MIRMLITDGSGELPGKTAGVDFIQVREPQLALPALTAYVRKLVRPGAPRVLVNDRADVAIACGAAGVHLRDGSVSPATIRRIARPGFIVSVSCHDADAAMNAAAEGADYVVLAPVFEPLSKISNRPSLGLGALRRIAASVAIPVIALGGITEENAQACIAAGAAGIAGITLFRR
jgi:thiamine-phosphate pyrophosphorylase